MLDSPTRPLARRALKIAVVSHTYLEPENRKNIVALSRQADVMVVCPAWGPVLVFRKYQFDKSAFAMRFFRIFRPLYVLPAQYLLLTADMGFARFKPDVIQVEYNPWSLMFLQALICRALYCRGAKIVCIFKKNTYRRYPGVWGWAKDRLARFSIGRVDHVLAASEMVKRLCREAFAVRAEAITVVHHIGVDIEHFAPRRACSESKRQNVTVGYCGRLDEDKGVSDLVAAVARCRHDGPRGVVLKIIGRGTLGPDLEQRAGGGDWLEVFPPVSNAEVADFLRQLDIFVLPSRILDDHQEHDAHALLEAMAAGVASIGTRSGIIPEILGGGAGVLVAPSAPNELADAVAALVRDGSRRQALAARARRKAEREWSLDRTAAVKIGVYRELIS